MNSSDDFEKSLEVMEGQQVDADMVDAPQSEAASMDVPQVPDEQGAGMDGEADVPALLEHEISKKRVALAGVGILLALALVCGGAWCISAQKPDAKKPTAVERVKSDEESASRTDDARTDASADEGKEEGASAEEDAKAGESATTAPSDNAGRESTPARAAEAAAPAPNKRNEPAGNTASSGAGDSHAKHTHNWVSQTTTVHHDAQYNYVHHDAVTKGVLICNHCNAQFESVEAWGVHIDSYINEYLATNPPFEEGTHTILVPNASYRTESVVVQPAWEEQVLVSEAWDETVTVGSVCASCGAVK